MQRHVHPSTLPSLRDRSRDAPPFAALVYVVPGEGFEFTDAHPGGVEHDPRGPGEQPV